MRQIIRLILKLILGFGIILSGVLSTKDPIFIVAFLMSIFSYGIVGILFKDKKEKK